MNCCGISNLVLEGFLAFFNLLWLFGWWSVGHYFYWAISNCRSNCQIVEPLGLGSLFVSQVIFFFFARHVLNFIYAKELPGGEKFTKEMIDMIGQAVPQGKRKGRK